MTRPKMPNAFTTDHGPFPHEAEHRLVEHYPEMRSCNLLAAGWWAENRQPYLYHVGPEKRVPIPKRPDEWHPVGTHRESKQVG